MELFLVFVLAISSSIAVGYLAVASENVARKLASNHWIAQVVSALLLFQILEIFINGVDYYADLLTERFGFIFGYIQRVANWIKIAIYTLIGIISLILIFVMPPYLILVIFGLIGWLIFRLK